MCGRGLSTRAEEKYLARSHLSARVDKPLPDIPSLLPSKQQLDLTRQEFPRRGIALSNGL